MEVGIVGTGSRAQSHCSSLFEFPGVEMTAVCDPEESRARETADQFDVEGVYADHGTMLDSADPDAVYVVTPPSAMPSVIPDCLERGLDVFAEKPLGITADHARELADLADRNDCTTMVGFQRRFHPLALAAKERIEERSPVHYGQATFHKHWTPPPYLLGHGCHALDLLVWMGDGVADVRGTVGSLYTEPVDHDPFVHADDPPDDSLFAAMVDFENGGMGYLNANNTAGGRAFTVEMHGRGISAYGEIHGDRDTDRMVIQADGESWADAAEFTTADVLDDDLPTDLARPPEYGFHPVDEGTFQMNRHFVACVREDVDTRIPFEEGFETMAALDRILRESRRFGPVFAET